MSDNSKLNLDTKVAAKYLFESIIDKERISPYTIIFPRSDIIKYVEEGILFGVAMERKIQATLNAAADSRNDDTPEDE